MVGFLFAFGALIFIVCLLFFMITLFSGNDGTVLIWTVFGMLNASIAMGVSEVLAVVKGYKQ